MFAKVLEVFNRPPADPVAKSFPLLASPWPVTILLLAYLLFVLKYGKKFMANRQPYDIKKIIVYYNFIQVLYNGIMFGIMFYYFYIDRAYDLRCMATLPFDSPYKNIERMMTYVYFINKIIDLLDTVFFVLRKSYKQITFLHVYHHALMVYAIYWVVRFYGFGAQFFSMAVANTFVHSVMYFYYMISAIDTGLKGNLWWKKYITKLQIIQFVVVMLHSVYVLVFNPTCEFPVALHYILLALGVIFITLFTNFYIKAYIKPQQHKQPKQQ